MVYLRTKIGSPSLRQLHDWAGGHGELPRSTLSLVLRGLATPSRRLLEHYVKACKVPPAEVDEWMAAWDRVNTLHRTDQVPETPSGSQERSTGTVGAFWSLGSGNEHGHFHDYVLNDLVQRDGFELAMRELTHLEPLLAQALRLRQARLEYTQMALIMDVSPKAAYERYNAALTLLTDIFLRPRRKEANPGFRLKTADKLPRNTWIPR